MSRSVRRPALTGALILAATVAVSGGALAQSPSAEGPVTAPPAPTGLEGSITISGSSTVQPISTAVQELFNVGSPGVAITVDGPGTGDGFALFCAGETDIADASRAIKAEGEADVCAANGVEYVEAQGGPRRPVRHHVRGQRGPGVRSRSPTCTRWSAPSRSGSPTGRTHRRSRPSLGSTTTFPDAPLTITAPGEESGTYDFFVEEVIAPIAEARGQEPFARPDYQASANDLTIVEGVAGTADNVTTLGWVGYAFVEENLDRIKPIAVDAGEGAVDPTYDSISDGSYPISRPLFIYVNTAKAAENPALAAFVDFYLAEGTVGSVLQTVPYVNLSAEEWTTTRSAWADR